VGFSNRGPTPRGLASRLVVEAVEQAVFERVLPQGSAIAIAAGEDVHAKVALAHEAYLLENTPRCDVGGIALGDHAMHADSREGVADKRPGGLRCIPVSIAW